MTHFELAEALTVRSTDATEIQLEVAGLGARSYAFLIDWHIRLVLALGWLAACALMMPVLGQAGLWWIFKGASPSIAFFVVVVPALVLYAMYHPVLEVAMHGRTPGKRMAGVHIVTHEGRTPGVSSLLIRNVFRLVDSLPLCYVVGIVVALISKQHVRIGDLAGGTLLVYERRLARDAFSVQAADAQELERRHLAKELLVRWHSLEREARIQLAQRLLGGASASTRRSQGAAAPESELRVQLQTLAGDVNG